MKTYAIASIPGDGIGLEVLPAACEVLDTVADQHGFRFKWTEFDWSCQRYLEEGSMMPEAGVEELKSYDQIFLGAVGYPGVPDHVSLWGLLIPIRRAMRQYINLRPIRLLPGLESPLSGVGEGGIDFTVVRENNEGEYSEIGGRAYQGTEEEIAVQESVFTRRGTSRAMRYAFDLATKRGKKLASATKSNGIVHSMPFWDEVFRSISEEYPEVEVSEYHIDALVGLFVLDPSRFDVVVASNLFGDILTDLGAAIVGSIGIAPSGNINPEGDFPSMFEPVHGSAPDIAGTGRANPLGQIWTGAMMLDQLGESEASADIMAAVSKTLSETKTRTPDLGGTASTREVVEDVIAELKEQQ